MSQWGGGGGWHYINHQKEIEKLTWNMRNKDGNNLRQTVDVIYIAVRLWRVFFIILILDTPQLAGEGSYGAFVVWFTFCCCHCRAACNNVINWTASWWRHQMEPFSVLLAMCAWNSPVPVNSPCKGQWRGALMFSLIWAWINGWVNNLEAGDLRCNRAHYDVIVMY